MGVTTIAVILGDNDYGNTFRPLLESVQRAIAYHGEISADDATRLIRDGIDWHYSAFQNLTHGEPKPGVLGYLGSVRILFDEAARDDVVNRDHDGGAWALDVDAGKVYSY